MYLNCSVSRPKPFEVKMRDETVYRFTQYPDLATSAQSWVPQLAWVPLPEHQEALLSLEPKSYFEWDGEDPPSAKTAARAARASTKPPKTEKTEPPKDAPPTDVPESIDLATADSAALRAVFKKKTGSDAPASVTDEQLRVALAHQLQNEHDSDVEDLTQGAQ